MAQRVPIPLATSQNEASTGAVGIEGLVNWYAEPAPPQSKVPFHLRGTPGLKPFITGLDGPIRALEVVNNLLYVLGGETLYEITSSGVRRTIGTIEGAANAHTTNNGVHVAICTQTKAYAANGSGITELSQSNLNGADYQDGYGIFPQRGTNFFWISNLDDLTTISPLDFTSADAESDNVVGCLVNNEELIIFKERTLEQWYNAGLAAFPYVRSQNGVVERGCASSGSIAQADRTAMFLGDDLRVYAMQGMQPQAVSTPDIERKIQAQSDFENSWAFTYEQQGQSFYQISFANLTAVYSLTTGLWHLRKSQGLERARANQFAKFGKRNLVGDYALGNVYELDLDTYDENGAEIIREATLPALSANGQPVFHGDLLVEFGAGVGLTTGQGSDPTLMLDWSDDLGNTWSNERTATMGAQGAYRTQASFTRLGRFAHTRHVRLTLSDPVEAHLVAAYASIEAGT